MYRKEHPNPLFYRNEWESLNGEWDFEMEFGASGKDRKLYESDTFSRQITVPFCPESRLSGIEYNDFMNCVWYMRKFEVSEEWMASGRVFIHFGAVDYKATVYVNKKEVGTHTGGYTSFQFDVTDHITNGMNVVCICAEDDNRYGIQPRGKQAEKNHLLAMRGTIFLTTTLWRLDMAQVKT